MYRWINGAWTYQALLIAPDGTNGDVFGGGVSGYGTTAAVGANSDGNLRGMYYV